MDNRAGELLPGSLAQVHFKTPPAGPAFIVPAAALIFRREGLRVGTVVNGNLAHLVPVVIGEDDGANVQIVTGLSAGDRVIQDPPDSLIEGEKLHVESPGQPRRCGRQVAMGVLLAREKLMVLKGHGRTPSGSRAANARKTGAALAPEGRFWATSSGAPSLPSAAADSCGKGGRPRTSTIPALKVRLFSLAAFLALALLTACKPVGPNYNRPGYEAPPAYKETGAATVIIPPPNPAGGGWQTATPSDGMLRGKWWEIYQDPQLNQLEERISPNGQPNNQALRQALETYLAARDQVTAARSALYPTLSAGPSASRQNISTNGPLFFKPASRPPTAISLSPARPVGSRISGAASAAPSKRPARTPRPAPRRWPAWT